MNDLTGVVYVNETSKPSIEELYELYKEYRDSDINEGEDVPEVLHFLYFVKHGNMHGKLLKDFRCVPFTECPCPNSCITYCKIDTGVLPMECGMECKRNCNDYCKNSKNKK